MYRDSEGTVGDEFYEEEIVVDEQTGTARRAMKRITENLTREASSINSNKHSSIISTMFAGNGGSPPSSALSQATRCVLSVE